MEEKNSTSEIKVIWKPELCQHAGVCVKMFPSMARTKETSSVTVENASSEELLNQMSICPWGALSYQKVNNPKSH